MTYRFTFLIVLLFFSIMAAAKVSEKFSVTTAEGISINFAVTNEEEKTCEVYGTSARPAVEKEQGGDIIIPSEANGYKVTSVGDRAFYHCANLVSITIPEGVFSIGNAAFEGCTNMKRINIPSSVEKIGTTAFHQCENLLSVTLPEGIKKISSGMFSSCYSLSSVFIPSSVTTIGSNAFEDCKQLADVIIPEGVTDIEMYAFYRCEGLTSIKMPSSLLHIALGAFSDCTQLTEVSIPENSQLTELGTSAFSRCSHLKRIYLPKSLKSLGGDVFNNCTSLESIELPEGIPSIDSNTFQHCESLTSVQIPASVTLIGFSAFHGCSALASVTFAEGCQLTQIEAEAFAYCIRLSSIKLPESVYNIGYNAFCNCENMTSIYIPQGVSQIGREAFMDCYKLESVVLPSHLETIEWNTFAYCHSLTSIIIPEGITNILNNAFFGCDKLAEVELPNTLTKIGDNAFYGCTSLKRVISHIEQPFSIARNVFEWLSEEEEKSLFSTATLYVPLGTKSLYEASGTWSQFPNIIEDDVTKRTEINTDEYKSKHLEYFDLTEEEWAAFGQRGYQDYLEYEFLGDTLHVTGIQPINCYDYMITCTIGEGNIRINIYAPYDPDGEQPDCMVSRRVEAKIPGFKEGVYQVSFEDEEPVEVVCGGSDYRPFIEDGKEWIVKCSVGGSYYLVHYAFSDDAEFVSVEGKPCRKLVERYDFSPMDKAGIGHPAIYGDETGFIYEEGKRVYFAVRGEEKLNLLYDFGAEVGDTINVYSTQENAIRAYIVEDKKKEESDCYKGICTQVRKDPGLLAVIYNLTDTWMEGVGGNRAPLENVDYGYLDGILTVLMTCTVGDEVIYKHPDWNFNEDAEGKKRIDFTHVVKTNPKGPQRKADGIPEEAVSGEYSSTALTIDLGTLRDAYAVTITDPSGQAVYTKSVKTNDVLALNIDISDYTTKGEYTITLENNQEVFTGILNRSEGVSIESLPTPQPASTSVWYDLTGRPVTHPTHGIYIKNHQKVYIK